MRSFSTELTSREREEFEQQKEITEMQGGYNLKLKEYEIEIHKLEARWASWLKLPMAVVLLPVKLIVALAIPIAAISKHELSESFWEFLRN